MMNTVAPVFKIVFIFSLRQILRLVAKGHGNVCIKKQFHCNCCDCSWSASIQSSAQALAICCTDRARMSQEEK